MLSIKPTIYAIQEYKEFLKYVEESDKIQLLTVKEMSEYFNVDEDSIRMVIEKYKIPGGTDVPGSRDWKYTTNRIKEVLEKEGINFEENEAYRPPQHKILTINQLSEEFNLDRDIIKNVIVKHNVAPEISGNREDLNWYYDYIVKEALEEEGLLKDEKRIEE